MKFVMSSATKAKLGALYTTANEMVPLCHTLIEMGWPQPCTPIQTDNSTAVGITNLTIIPQKTKSMDLRLWWLRCQESQQQFLFYWDKGSHNWADYHTKLPTHLPQGQQTHTCWCSRPIITLNWCPTQATAAFLYLQTHQPDSFFSLQAQLRMSLQGCIVYLLLTYGMCITSQGEVDAWWKEETEGDWSLN
jgi:hypothetical protein